MILYVPFMVFSLSFLLVVAKIRYWIKLQVEAALLSSEYVDSIMVYADPFHNYCIALVVPSREALLNWAEEYGFRTRNLPELCDRMEAIKEVQQSLYEVCALLLRN